MVALCRTAASHKWKPDWLSSITPITLYHCRISSQVIGVPTLSRRKEENFDWLIDLDSFIVPCFWLRSFTILLKKKKKLLHTRHVITRTGQQWTRQRPASGPRCRTKAVKKTPKKQACIYRHNSRPIKKQNSSNTNTYAHTHAYTHTFTQRQESDFNCNTERIGEFSDCF